MSDKWPYGETSEIEIICTLIKDKVLLSWVANKLSPEDFNNEILGEIWHIIRDMWFKYRECPELRPLVAEVQKAIKDDVFLEEDIPVVKASLKEIKTYKASNAWTKEKLKVWLKERDYQNFVMKSQQALARGDISTIDKQYRDLIRESSPEASAEKDDFFKRITEIAENALKRKDNLISTGIKEIDYILSGGMARNELGLVFGVDGLGKSFILNQIGMSCVTAGLRVLHITNELPAADVETRYLSGFTSIPLDQYAERMDEIIALSKQLKAFEGMLDVEYVPPQSSPDVVWSLLEAGQFNNKPYDVVLLDYLDRFLIDGKTRAQWQDLIEVMDSFSYMAKPFEDGGFNCLIVAVTHADSGAYGKTHVGPGHMGSSKIGKNKSADFVMSISADDDDKEKGIVRLTTTKLRYRPWPEKNRAVLQTAYDKSTLIPKSLDEVEI